jgi:hypothetical protein
MCDVRVVLCETCGSEGRIYVTCTDYSPHWGYTQGQVDIGRCEACEGTGGELIGVAPIDEDDLENMSGGENEPSIGLRGTLREGERGP